MALAQSLKKGGGWLGGGGWVSSMIFNVVHNRANDNQVVATTMNNQDKCVE